MPFHKHGELTLPVNIRLIFLVSVLSILWGCAAVKKPPKGKPFVYENVVKLTAPSLTREQKIILQQKLLLYIDDSLAVPTRQVIGFTQRVKPPVFDSAAIYRSIKFMNSYLNSEGFYNARFDTFLVKIDTAKKGDKQQQRVYTTFLVNAGKGLRIDTVVYAFKDSNLQRLADSSKVGASLKVNTYYSKQAVAYELDRLATIFRNHGYFKMSRYVMLVEVDTANQALVNFEIDPIQQQLLALKKREDPTASIRIYQRPGTNPSAFRSYTIDSVIIYPETKILDNIDSLIMDSTFKTLSKQSNILVKEKAHLFQEKMLLRNNYLIPGKEYNEQNYFRTINSFGQMGPWQQSDIRTFTHIDTSDASVAFHLFLYPAKKQSFQIDLEGSQNNNISSSNVMSGKFFALGLVGTHRNRNVWKKGTQSTTTGRVGFELNNESSSGNAGIFQSFILGLNQSYSIPRLLWPMHFFDNYKLDNRRSVINLGYLYNDRFDFYQRTSANANLTYEWRRKKNTYTLAFPNFETVNTISTDSLKKEIQENPSLAYSFAPGNVLSISSSFKRVIGFKNHLNRNGLFQTSAEVTIPGNFTLFNREFFKFVKVDAQYIHHIRHANTSWDFRMYAGVGWEISGSKTQNTMPFFRQFVAGGSYSMRAWSLRQLGLGNSLAADTAAFTDRFGDIQLETNIERRFQLMRLFGYKLDGVVFTDIGNIWNHQPVSDGLGNFDVKYLYRDLALDAGLGIRWDLDFLVIRFDGAFKVKDPVREGDGWLKTFEWKSTNRLGTNKRGNVAVQFGIGYPF